MNCYGIAIHVHATVVTDFNPYIQQPGEFIRDNQSYFDFCLEMYYKFDDLSITSEALLNYLEQKMYGDFAALRNADGNDWTITRTTQTASVPAGYRKIALTIGIGHDYHFYMRHSDGTWSHKPGGTEVTNLSLDTRVVITDSNIATAAREGRYDDGVRYYLIKKPPIIDYVHGNGHNDDSLYTPFSFKDKAGETLKTSTTISGTSFSAMFDYLGDIDCYAFTPASSGEYTFSTSIDTSAYSVTLAVYDTYGNKLKEIVSTGTSSLTVSMQQNTRYFIEVLDSGGKIRNYTLYYNK